MDIETYGFTWEIDNFREFIDTHPFLNKPLGGLWGSPVESKRSWKDWCKNELFFLDKLREGFVWELEDTSRNLILDSEKKYLEILPEYRGKGDHLNWSKIAEDYDAVWLTTSGLLELKETWEYGFSSWDCESIVVFRKEVIKFKGKVTS